MADRIRCACQRCTVHGLMGPAVLIALGVLFLLNEWRGDYLGFHYTWPVLLIVIGLIKLAESLSSMEGHGTAAMPPAPDNPGQGR